jgi:pimeloyl-ACP methyl ester carboxylesterase
MHGRETTQSEGEPPLARIESLLSARLFLSPQRWKERLYFISNLGGQLSLYAMDTGGSVPEPLLPADIALQNPLLLRGIPFHIFPDLGKLLVMIDSDGDENYRPMMVPLDGGIPTPYQETLFAGYRSQLMEGYPGTHTALLLSESRDSDAITAFLVDLAQGDASELYTSPWLLQGQVNSSLDKAVFVDRFGYGDHSLVYWELQSGDSRVIYGTPLAERTESDQIPPNGIEEVYFANEDQGVIFITSLYDDAFGLGYLDLQKSAEVEPVTIRGTLHTEKGELAHLKHITGDRFLLIYNINGCSWAYESIFDADELQMEVDRPVLGQNKLTNGYVQSVRYEGGSDSFVLSFSTATSPSQIFTIGGPQRETVVVHTRERVLGIPQEHLSSGEEASYTSFDGMQIYAHMYFPSDALGYQPPFPLIYYLHGGPHGQERPDFTWFSIPLIQFMTLHGFAVFVPNVRGSTGYGMRYTKLVDRDWGGDDRLDHAHALKVLAEDQRIDTRRVGLVGRSYGGYMSLTLAGRHPELWSAAVDMFGPYDLLTFLERIPPTWKAYYRIALGDADDEADRPFLRERSPRTHLHQLACPLLVIQGKNDPRVVEKESSDLVQALRSSGKQVDYLLFENEGHDVLKFENRVRCYNAIRDFFLEHVK